MITWHYKPSGLCPVQSEGIFLNYYFYFRSRHDRATIDFAKSEKDWIQEKVITFTLLTTESPKAGYLPKWKCILLIYWGCIRFLFKKYKL
jgi:hypothetical protein